MPRSRQYFVLRVGFFGRLFLSLFSILFDIRHSSPSRYTLQALVSWPTGRADYVFSLRVNWVAGFTRAAVALAPRGLDSCGGSGTPCRTTSAPLQGASIASGFC